MKLDDLFRYLIESGGSDLIMRTRARPSIRVDGQVRFASETEVSPSMAQDLFDRLRNQGRRLHTHAGRADEPHRELSRIRRRQQLRAQAA